MRHAFTLLELLVAIAIIGVLTSLMLPALGLARAAAQRGECVSNARQLVLAAGVYADDHRGFLPPGAPDILSNLTRWHGVRTNPSEPFAARGGLLTEYLGESAEDGSLAGGVRRCSSFLPTLRALGEQGRGFELTSGGYGYNNAFVGVQRRRLAGDQWAIVTDRSGSNISVFSTPSSTICFADAAFASDQGVGGVIEYSFIEPRFWPDFPGARADPSMHFRHAGAASVAWLDGHVAPQQRTASWTSGIYGVDPASVGIGFCGDTDDNALYDPL